MKLTPSLLEQGQLPTWSESEAERISQLETFQPNRERATSVAAIRKALRKQLEEAGYPEYGIAQVVRDIIELARFKAHFLTGATFLPIPMNANLWDYILFLTTSDNLTYTQKAHLTFWTAELGL